ncbi:endoplasmic reticulum resident protein 44-like [Elysia marginata]|uniref:Endoplasmic reticulum resident protein 44-like n=1 Tax=Elysia marginata TaxID=1093978 RepID=A0AAV4GN71_9GAST|nr:endoplasmic reticulum resident protein 44-like [Elysia marginata]
MVSKHSVDGEAVSLNLNNAETVLSSSDIAVVNFYADWCRFSQILAPTFDEAGRKIQEELSTPGSVVFAKVDCDREGTLAARYRINKYPTLKIFRGGVMMKKEYRGQRSVDALVQFAKDESKPSINDLQSMDELNSLDMKKLHIIGYFDSKEAESFRTFSRVASILRDDCQFHAAVGPISVNERAATGDRVNFRSSDTTDQGNQYPLVLTDFDSLYKWSTEKCTPLVREITFENAEELTEEGLPFVILFHHPDDSTTPTDFRNRVQQEAAHEKASVNFLVADGLKFAHPLHHLGKSAKDLPILAIDSFRHMYIFPHPVKQGLNTDGLLKKFIEDLHSGKLHREFHHGPDPTPPAIEVIASDDKPEPDSNTKNVPRDDVRTQPQEQKITSPPESTFKKLGPSRNRYTILRDEL